jgi:lysozyme
VRTAIRRLLAAAIATGVLLTLAWVLLSRGFVRFVYPSWAEYPVRGVDVSHHNGRVDWPRIRAAGYTFAYLKASEGIAYRDSTFARNRDGARAAGLVTGGYHYFSLCSPGREQARNFAAAMGLPRAGSLPAAVDLEFGGNCGQRPSRGALWAELNAFLAVLDSAGYQPTVLYATKEFHHAYLDGQPVTNPLWVRSVFGRPRFGGAWVFWQYAATGRVDGAEGRIDLNFFRGSPADFRTFLTLADSVRGAR